MSGSDTPGAGGRVPPGAVRPPRGIPRVVIEREHLYKAVALAFLLAVVYRYLDAVVQVFLLAYAAAILAVLFNAVVRRFPLERRWMTALLGVLILASLAALLWFGIPLLLAQLRDLVRRGPEFAEQLRGAERWLELRTGMELSLLPADAREILQRTFAGAGSQGSILSRASGVLGALLLPLLVIFGALYATGKPNQQLLSSLMRAVPRDRRLAARRVLQLLGDRILGWGRGLLVSMGAVGVLSFVLYSVIGVPNAFLLAVIAALTEAIPLVGPWIGGATAVAVAAVDDPTKALWTAGAAVVIQQVEGNVIMPFAMSRAAEVHPFVTLFALLLFGTLFGFLGVLLSIPLVLLIATLVEVLWVERAIDTDEDAIAPVVEE